ncbi:MAG: isopentenyl-diphosphate Delta-isomerase [Woeseiaceae bacterium]|nr:isopentenyl-diphosphate Delta-isomerase [Woeseiaceae bacterium]
MQSANRIVSSEAEELILVDSDDNPVGQLSKAAAHDGDGRLHRAFSVFLFNANGELLLQQRGRDKRLWPGFWSNSCCSHPRVGESMEVATRRRLDDELNLESELEYVYRFQYQANYSEAGSEHELCHVFVGRVDDKVVPNANEIEAVRFVPAGSMADLLQNDPDRYTPWFKLEWRTLMDEHSDVLARYI